MKLSKKPKRENRPDPLSFRFSREAQKQLKALAKETQRSMTDVLEELIASAYKDTVENAIQSIDTKG